MRPGYLKETIDKAQALRPWPRVIFVINEGWLLPLMFRGSRKRSQRLLPRDGNICRVDAAADVDVFAKV